MERCHFLLGGWDFWSCGGGFNERIRFFLGFKM